tara:strand:- start:1667 stop:2569 length:903 start_codon:yes stop_codon:yes gene_type:complete
MYAPTNRVEFGKTNYDGSADMVEYLLEGENLNRAAAPNKIVPNVGGEGYFTTEENIANEIFNTPLEKLQLDPNFDLMLEDKVVQPMIQRKIDEKEELDKKNKAYEKKDDVKEEEVVVTEKEDTLDDRRKRMAIWGPLLKNARGIAESETLGGALLGGLETAGEAMQGSIAADEAVIGRASALRTAQVQEAMDLAGISKKLSKDELRIAFLDAAATTPFPEMKEKFFNAAAAIDESDMGPALEADIGSLLNPYINLGSEAIPIAPAPAQKEGGPVKLAKGGTPERSFDFIPKDGKLIAVPK